MTTPASADQPPESGRAARREPGDGRGDARPRADRDRHARRSGTAESARHEQKRVQLAEKLAATDPKAEPDRVPTPGRSSSRSRGARPSWRRRSTSSTASAGPSPATATPIAAIADAIDALPADRRTARRRRRGRRERCRRDVTRGDERPGGPAARDRAGDARRPGAVAHEHRAPGGQSWSACSAGIPSGAKGELAAPRVDGPAHARGDEELHLRRAADGARRPGRGAHAAPHDARPRPQGEGAGRVRVAGAGATPADGPREHDLPDPRRRARRLPRAVARAGPGPPRLDRRARGQGDRGALADHRERRAAARGAQGRARRHPADDPGPPRRAPRAGRGGEEAAIVELPANVLARRLGPRRVDRRRRADLLAGGGELRVVVPLPKEPTEGGGAMRRS